MPRFILIDNHTGYVWGDSADLNGGIFVPTAEGLGAQAVEYAAALDASNGEHDRSYLECSRHALASNETGYHVYRADVGGSEAIGIVRDGQDQETIDSVVRDCEYVSTIRCSAREG